MEERLVVEVGRLHWKAVRNLVQIMRHQGAEVYAEEGKGWLSRPFLLRGSRDAMQRVTRYLECLRENG